MGPFQEGDIVVIDHMVWDDTWEWISQMDGLVGCVGVVTDHVEYDLYRVQVFHPNEAINVNKGFVYRSEALRPATEEEKRSYQLVHLIRRRL